MGEVLIGEITKPTVGANCVRPRAFKERPYKIDANFLMRSPLSVAFFMVEMRRIGTQACAIVRCGAKVGGKRRLWRSRRKRRLAEQGGYAFERAKF